MEISERIEFLYSDEPQGPAVQFKGAWWTWGDCREIRDRLDVLLDARGVGSKEAIGVIARQSPQSVAACLALLSREKCVVLLTPIQPDYALCEDVRKLGLAAIIGHEEDWSRDGLGEAASSVATGCFQFSSTGQLQDISTKVALQSVDAKASVEPDRYIPAPGVAITVLSSGTTGPPKRIPLSYEMLKGEPPKSKRDPAQRGVNIAAVPLVSIGGVLGLVQGVWRGRPMALMERFDVWTWANLVHEHKPRRLGAPPAALSMLLNEQVPPHLLASGTVFTAGSAPVSLEISREFERVYGIPVLRSYGATEFMGNVIGFNDDEMDLAKSKEGSVGRPRPGVRLRIVDPHTTAEVTAGQVGLLEVDSPRRALGAPAGWISTNDLARIDEDGFVWIMGRVDGVIIRGGFKVSTEEVAATLIQHPDVLDAAVVGLPDPRLNEVPFALVVMKDPAGGACEEELKEWVKSRMPPYCVPKRTLSVESIPRNAMMKVIIPDVKQTIMSVLSDDADRLGRNE